jgi:hypothetical protein
MKEGSRLANPADRSTQKAFKKLRSVLEWPESWSNGVAECWSNGRCQAPERHQLLTNL